MLYVWLFILFALGFSAHLKKLGRKAEIAMQATFADCDVDNEWFKWKMAHPGRYVGDDLCGREIIARKIETRKRFLETHPTYDDSGHLDKLHQILAHTPISPRNKRKKRPIGASSFIRRRH